MSNENKDSGFSLTKTEDGIATNVISGFLSGFLTGLIIGKTEGVKVKWETHGSPSFNAQWPRQVFKDLVSIKAGAIIPFSLNFGAVVALEASLIAGVEKNYGQEIAPVVAGISGAFWLTIADHIFYRREAHAEKATQALLALWRVRPTAILAGYVPMLGREIAFSATHFQISKYIGKMMYNAANTEDTLSENQIAPKTYQFVGSLLTGPLISLLTQPLDTGAREMQKQVSRNESPSLLNAFSTLYKTNGLFRGAVPRMVLASIGGGLANTGFQKIRSLIEPEGEHVSQKLNR